MEGNLSIDDLIKLASAIPFKPHAYYSLESDSITVSFREDADYSEQLTPYITIYRRIDKVEDEYLGIVGCRIDNVDEILRFLCKSMAINDQFDFRFVLLALYFHCQQHSIKALDHLNYLVQFSKEFNIKVSVT